MRKFVFSFIISILLLHCLGLNAQQKKPFIHELDQPNAWVDSVFKKLNRKQRIAQLFFVRAHTDKGKAFEDSIAKVIRKEKIGGLVFFQGGPGRQLHLTKRYQQLARVPLLIAMDAEWGLGMRLDSTMSYPYQMTLGAIQDENLIENMGHEIAHDLKRLGVHINFAPVLDINNNPKNPVIGFRSFGDDKLQVARKASAYMKGMQEKGILVSLKHFPGHGDTDVDSHYDLPQLNFDRSRLDTLEMYPFKELIKNGASGVMVAHMNIPALDASTNLPSTLSKPIVSGILKNELRFKGLVFSDAMGMKGVVKFFPNGEADVRALMAGNDVLELSENSKRGVKLIRKAIRKKRISREQINESVKKVLAAKYWAGLYQTVKLNPTTLNEDLHRPSARALNQQLADAAVTVLNSRRLIDDLDPNKKTIIVSLGSAQTNVFQEELRTYFKQAEFICLDKAASAQQVEQVLAKISSDLQIIVSIHDTRKRPAPVLDFNPDLIHLMNRLAQQGAIISVFANPYTLIQLPEIAKAQTLVLNYQNSDEMQKAAVKVMSKAIPSKGKLPVNINASLKNGDGL